MDRHPRAVAGGAASSSSSGRTYVAEMESVGEHYEYATKDLLGHGAFACVFKGRSKEVRAENVTPIVCEEILTRNRPSSIVRSFPVNDGANTHKHCCA